MKMKYGLMLLAFVMTFSVAVQADLVAYWTFDSDVAESQGNTQFDGTAVGNAAVSSDDVAVGSGSLKIDDDTGSANHVNIATSPFIGNEKLFTVVCWYKYKDISGDGSDGRPFIMETDNYHVSYGCRLAGDQVEIAEWYLRGLPGWQDTSGPVVDVDTWHHGVLIYDAENGFARHYVDGQLRDEAFGTPGVGLNTTTYLNIGSHRDGNGSRNFDGYIDDVAVFDQALSLTQVEALYNKTHTPDTVGEVEQLEVWGQLPNDGMPHIIAGTELQWRAPADVVDPTYNVYLSTDPAMASGNVTLANGITETATDLPFSLDDNTTYYWRVDTVGGEAGDILSFKSTEGLVAYWPFEEDPNMANTQGNADFDGEQIGNATVSTEDFVRGAAALRIDDNGTTANLVHVGNSPIVGGQKVYTVCAWYKFKDISNNGFDDRNFVFETTLYSASFGIREAGDPSAKRSQYVVNATGNQFTSEAADGPVADDGNWHHVALVFNALEGTKVSYYHDGALLLSSNSSTSLILTDSDLFNIGDYRGGNGDRNWDGYIDDVAVYDRELFSGQIAALYSGDATPLNVQSVLKLTATDPTPANGSSSLDPSGIELSWFTPEDNTDATYNVYLSTDPNMIMDVVSLATDLSETIFTLPDDLEHGQEYFWRVDSKDGGVSPGDIWSFKTYKGMIAHWPFDDDMKNAQGDAEFDGVVEGNAVVSGEVYVVGSGALMIDDDTNSSNYVKIENSPFQQNRKVFTVTAWYQVNDINGDGTDTRPFVFETNDWNVSLGCRYETNPEAGQPDVLDGGEWYFNGSPGANDTSGPIVDPNSWHHAALAYNAISGDMKFYFDGQLRDHRTGDSGSGLNTTSYLNIGSHRAGDGGRNFDGYIDDVAVYDVELTAYQIQQMVEDDSVDASNVLSARKLWADFNGDGTVESEDLSMFVAKWLSDDSGYDADGSGVVDLVDFSIFANSWLD